MKKKILSAVLALALVLGGAASLPQGAFDEISTASVSAEVSGDWEYQILGDGTAELIGYNGKNTTVTIPSTLGGKKVTSIYFWSFAAKPITSVSIPSTVTKLDPTAFNDCTKLVKINVDSNNKNYSSYDGVLYNKTKTNLIFCPAGKKTVSFPSSIKYINQFGFSGCVNLERIAIPNSVVSIGGNAFAGCINLKSATLPNSINKITECMFTSCQSLTSLTIPSSVKSIEGYAFDDCTNLKSITIPSSVTSIGDKAFGYDSLGKKISGFTIYGESGTAAQTYAKKNGFKFVAVPKSTRLKGSGRFATAAAISTAAYPQTAETVILANGTKFADALAGATLAKVNGAPILLTEANSLPADTLAEIKRLKAKKVIILGGSGSVGQKVKDELDKNGLKYEIVKGSSRFATAVEIANKTKAKTKKDPTEIFFVSSDKFADALSVSAVAALKNAPIIYLPKTGAIDDVTAAYLKTMKGKNKNAYVIGGSGVISNEVVKAAAKALGLTVDKTIVRVKGSTKYDTCVAVNTKFASVLTGKAICVATGEDFPDALAGGVFAAQKSAPLFLAAGALSDTQKSYLQTKNADSIFVFGGSKSVPDSLVQSIAAESAGAPGSKYDNNLEIV